MSDINTHGMTVEFGKHKGELYTRLPVSYLRWMVQVGHRQADVAKAELDRRGTTIPKIEVSGHAIDRASLSLRKTWHETRGEDEGLHAWLCRIAAEGRDKGEQDEEGRYHYLGIKLVFEEGAYPVLKTCHPSKRKPEGSEG